MLCGIDEAGRGPLAGPVTAAAVVLPDDFDLSILNDSKKMTPLQRRKSAAVLIDKAVGFGIGWVWPSEIDEINIHHASLLAMKKAFMCLKQDFVEVSVCRVLVDGKFYPPISVKGEAVIKGDSKIPEIQAASILAKEARDRWMIRYSWIESRYGYEKHKGYPTLFHRQKCRELGPSCIQRRTFNF